jgi:fermentation-respiration switch protein FrsA (DUF1100 family)
MNRFTRLVLVVCVMVLTGIYTGGMAMAEKLDNNTDEKFTSVIFNKGSLKIAGNLYLPEKMEPNKKYPAIVVVHPGGGVKEQTAGLYAQKLSQQGFIALAFDAAHQGASEGFPRFLEDPAARVEDIRSAVDYLTTLSYVEADKIGALGICAGGGYAISAAQTEHRIKAVAGVSAVDIGLTFRTGWDGKGSLADQIKTLEAVAKQRTAEANGTDPMYVHYVPEVNELTEKTEPDLREALIRLSPLVPLRKLTRY